MAGGPKAAGDGGPELTAVEPEAAGGEGALCGRRRKGEEERKLEGRTGGKSERIRRRGKKENRREKGKREEKIRRRKERVI